MFDVAIVGSGPGGATCAAFCARAGLRTLLLEREKFPREKVCGDCLNPACLPVLERLGVADELRALPHGKLQRVEFVAIGGQRVRVNFDDTTEIAIKRSLLDQLLMTSARAAGVEVHEDTTVTDIAAGAHWGVTTSAGPFAARILVAADGRNSTVARLRGLLPRIEKERVGLQTHLSLPRDFGPRVVLQFLPEGYSGQAPVNDDELNLCLVGRGPDIPALRSWAEKNFGLARDHAWRTITPLRRAPIAPGHGALLLVGDAARVVEPFTGEGIFYALRSGELAAESISRLVQNGEIGAAARQYAAAHEQLYRGRLWINRLARAAVLWPRVTSMLLRAQAIPPPLLRRLTSKILR